MLFYLLIFLGAFFGAESYLLWGWYKRRPIAYAVISFALFASAVIVK